MSYNKGNSKGNGACKKVSYKQHCENLKLAQERKRRHIKSAKADAMDEWRDVVETHMFERDLSSAMVWAPKACEKFRFQASRLAKMGKLEEALDESKKIQWLMGTMMLAKAGNPELLVNWFRA